MGSNHKIAHQTVELPRYKVRHGKEELQVPPTGLLVGRSSDCQVCLRGGLVSRHHARLMVKDDALVVTDLESRNGVYVNRRKITKPTAVAHGDVVGIGLEQLEVVDDMIFRRPEHMTTLPPSSAPPGEADTDVEQETVAARLDALSQREIEILELIVLGHTQKEMASQLHISVKTVETHRANLSQKLGCKTRAALVSYAITAGILRHKGFER